MPSVRMTGELANQLFCLAFATALSEAHNTPVNLDFRDVNFRLGPYKLSSNLNVVNTKLINSSFVQGSMSNSIKHRFENFVNNATSRIRYNSKIDTTKHLESTYRETNSHEFNEALFFGEVYNEYFGYFQCWKYSEPHLPKIIQMLQIEDKLLSKEYYIFQSMFIENPNVISIHIRRYREPYASYHGNLRSDYYLKAIEIANPNDTQTPNVAIFTDNQYASKKIIEDLGKKTNILKVITPNEIKSQQENLQLMSLGNSFIGSNSSYSWWAARMMSENKLKIFPNKWYAFNNFDINNLIPENWLNI